MRLYDAHNHLQDDRFQGRQPELLSACRAAGVARMVVNGAAESDWPAVRALAGSLPEVLPSLGYHPWYLDERTPDWQGALIAELDRAPAGIGEIGLDRWKPELPYAGQEEAFIWQLRLAAERNLPASIHCLRTWGRLLELLQATPRPKCGFLLHSYGGPPDMVPAFARLGAYFGFPGYFARPDKERKRAAFRAVPPDRLLVETDAPDQLPPPALIRHPLPPPCRDTRPGAPPDREPNHPANLGAIYEFLAADLGEPAERLAERVEANFLRLFGGLIARRSTPAIVDPPAGGL